MKCTKIYNNHHDDATLTISCGSERTRVKKNTNRPMRLLPDHCQLVNLQFSVPTFDYTFSHWQITLQPYQCALFSHSTTQP